jgi:hypothetical protein
MSKNLTRKGLALGALMGLATTAIAGTPAFAADEVVFALSSGTVYAAPVDDTLTLNASLVSSVPAANIQQLKYKVVTDGSFVAKVVINSAGVANTAHYTNGATGAYNADLTGVGALHYAPTTGAVYTPSTTPTTVAANTIAISVDSVANATTATTGDAPSATTATKSVTVTAWIDSNNDGVVDSGEFQKAQTLSFKKYSEITATYALTAPSAGATSVKGTATFTNINQNQLTKTVTMKFSKNAVDAAAAVTPTVSSGVYTGTDSSATFSGGLAAGDVIGVRALLATAELGSTEVTAAATARTIDALAAGAIVAGDNATAAGAVRNGGSFTARAKTTLSSAAVAGVSGTATFATSGATLSDTVYVTINGTAYKTAAALSGASVSLTSDADGYLSVSITTTGFVATNSITTTFTAQNFTTNTAVATVADAVYYAVDVKDLANVGTAATPTGNIALASSATTTVDYQVMDQFGVAPADSTFRAVLTGAAAAYQPVVAGKASFIVTGGSAAQNYTIGLEKWVATSASYDTTYVEGASNDNGFRVVTPASTLAGTVGSLTVTTTIAADGNYFATSQTGGSTSSTTKLSLSNKAFSAVDTRLDKKTAAPTLAAGYSAGTVTAPTAGTAAGNAAVTLNITPKGSDVAATALPATVTVSGTGLMFQVGTEVFATDKITLIAAAAGTNVKVYSHKAGDNVVTITSGAATKTVTLSYQSIAAEASNVVFASLPAQAQAGRTMDLGATVVDQWANTVAGASVAFNNTGVGYVQSTAAVTSDANGKVAGRLITLAQDLGTTYLSATLDLATDVVIAKSIEFGLTDADAVAGGHRVFVNYEFAMGKTLTVTIDGVRKYSKLITSDIAGELAFTQKKAGYHTVTVRISGGIVFTEKVKTN